MYIQEFPKTYKQNAVIVDVLFIIATVFFFIGSFWMVFLIMAALGLG